MTAKYTFFSSIRRTCTKINHFLGHKTNLDKFKSPGSGGKKEKENASQQRLECISCAKQNSWENQAVS